MESKTTHTERERLAEILGALAHGDGAAVFWLVDEFGDRIAGAVRRHLRHLGVDRPDPDDVRSLVHEACLELAIVAPGWDPNGGALPWNWAERRLRSMVARHVGQHTVSLDDAERPVPVPEPEWVALPERADHDHLDRVLVQLARRDPVVALVLHALEAVLSERDRAVLLDHRVQQELGDTSPAHTVAAMHGMSPDAVRQVVSRARRRVARWLREHGGPDDLALVA